ncbi:NAD(P)H-binding protein [Actinoallomurus purpureus]|uniref:SDR family oxidoreductase n=1 Tax=Actinoallomurus purpureus TaxID=478114 RepID=UPI002093DCED|nr:NAD(P)H-binding protein [Actinoallomurus purpureus]MCO6010326.1 NAD(P)H-binding protein [Actinoallomurus purpureus]
MEDEMTTLVIGARGSVGCHVVDQLLAAGEPVRASVRDPSSADLSADVSVVAADLTKADTLRAALAGVRKVFLYAPAGGVDAFIDAARDADLERIVLLSSGSVLLPYAVDNAIAEEHRSVERAMAGSGLPWMPIRPLVLANNTLNWADSIRTERVVRLIHPEAVMAPIHERDVAAVAVAALLGKAGDEAGAMLTGSEALSQRRQVELIGAAIDEDIRVDELSESQARDHFRRFADPDIVDAIIEFVAAAANGGSPATDTAEQMLGRPAVHFAQWARDHATVFR